jgi:hypothetical protein
MEGGGGGSATALAGWAGVWDAEEEGGRGGRVWRLVWFMGRERRTVSLIGEVRQVLKDRKNLRYTESEEVKKKKKKKKTADVSPF